MRPLIPAAIAPSLARHAHRIEVPASARIIRTAGQLGISADVPVPPP